MNFYLADNCEGGWNTLWPLAKNGDKDAMYLLAEALKSGCPFFPLTYGDNDVRLRLNFYAYAILQPSQFSLYRQPGHPNFFRSSLGQIVHIWFSGKPGMLVQACYASVASSRECLDKAVKLGVFRSFGELVDAIDNPV